MNESDVLRQVGKRKGHSRVNAEIMTCNEEGSKYATDRTSQHLKHEALNI